MRHALLAASLGAALLATGCFTVGRSFPTHEVTAIEIGKTTRDQIERTEVESTAALRARMDQHLAGTAASIWEPRYVVFHAARAGVRLGDAVVVEEIGKHRLITFVVGVRSDGTVNDVAVVAYREAYGGEVKTKRFLGQYRDKSAADALQSPADIKNIAGATLSVEAASRAVKKALALARAVYGVGGGT